MKSFIFIFSFIGVNFVRANLVGTLDGVLDLLPYLNHAAASFYALGDAQKAFAKALNNSKNCGSSGSNIPLLNVAEGNENVAKAFSALASALRNNTDGVKQLKLVRGNLSKVTDQIDNAADALESLSKDIRTLTDDNIDTVSWDGVDQLVASLKTFRKSSDEFNADFTNFAFLPSRLLLQLVSIPLLSNFTNSVKHTGIGFEAATEAIRAAEKRCNISTGLPDATSSMAEIAFIIHENLLILKSLL